MTDERRSWPAKQDVQGGIDDASLFESMPYAFALLKAITDEAGSSVDFAFVKVNRAFVEQTGTEASEIVGQKVSQTPPDLGQPTFMERYRAVALSREAMAFEAYLPSLQRYCHINAFSPESGHLALIVADVTTHKQAEKALREPEVAYRMLANNSRDWEYWVSGQGRILYCSPSCERMTGYRAEEFEADPHLLVRIIHPGDQALYTGYHRRSSIENQLDELEFRIICRDREERWVGHLCHPVYDIGGRLLGRRASNRDITKRKRLEQALRESEQKFRGIVEQSGDGIALIDEQGVVVEWNRSKEQITGLMRAEVVGRPIWDVLFLLLPTPCQTPQRRASVEAAWLGYLSTGEASWLSDLQEVTVQRPDSTQRDVQILVFPIPTSKGFLSCSLSRDITARKRAEEGVRFLAEASDALASSLDYEATLHNVVELAVPALADRCIVYLLEGESLRRFATASSDPSKEELTQELWRRYPTSRESPHTVWQAIHTSQPFFSPPETEAYLASIAQDADHLAILRALGIESLMALPLVAHQRILGALLFVSGTPGRRYGPLDLTLAEGLAHRAAMAIDNARLYREVQQAVEAREEFLSVAAHELKTPLTSLRGFAQLTLRQLDRGRQLDPGRIRHALQIIDQQADRVSKLVNQLLDVSRIEARHLVIDRRSVDLVELVEGVIMIAGMNTSQHELILRAPSSLLARVDAVRLEEVVTNLIDNAIRYSPDGGAIDVELSTPDQETVRLSVRDHGIGIPPEHRQEIFGRFYQAHAEQQLGGLGLGLYISSQIVQLHGGRIDAEFPADGGTRFVVLLPRGLDEEDQ